MADLAEPMKEDESKGDDVGAKGDEKDSEPDEAKAPYVELAQTDAKRYKAEAAAYLAKM